MIKLTFCRRRKAGLTRDGLQKNWLHTYGPLVAERAAQLGVAKYVQVDTADAAGLHDAFRGRNGGSPEPFDGAAELWFESVDAFGSGDDAARRAPGRDEGAPSRMPPRRFTNQAVMISWPRSRRR